MDLQVCVYISGTWGMQTVLGLCACCMCGAYPPRQHWERGNEMQTGCAEPEQFLLPTHQGNWLSCELQTKAKERTNQQITMSDWCSGGSELTPGSNIQYPSLCMCVTAPLEWSQKMGCGHWLDGATAIANSANLCVFIEENKWLCKMCLCGCLHAKKDAFGYFRKTTLAGEIQTFRTALLTALQRHGSRKGPMLHPFSNFNFWFDFSISDSVRSLLQEDSVLVSRSNWCFALPLSRFYDAVPTSRASKVVCAGA